MAHQGLAGAEEAASGVIAAMSERRAGVVGACQTSSVGEGVVPMMGQYFGPAQVGAGLKQDIIACWITVSNAGGAAGFPFPPVDASIVAPVADDLIAGLSPEASRLASDFSRASARFQGWL